MKDTAFLKARMTEHCIVGTPKDACHLSDLCAFDNYAYGDDAPAQCRPVQWPLRDVYPEVRAYKYAATEGKGGAAPRRCCGAPCSTVAS